MTLIKSISGIRGTIGGKQGDNLTPLDLVRFTAAYAKFIKVNRSDSRRGKLRVVVGRDARISGQMVEHLVEGTLMSCGIDVISLALASTPTVELAVTELKADGGLILTASHNPKQWNALKLLNASGEFLDDKQGKEVLRIAEASEYEFVSVDELGERSKVRDFDSRHIDMVLALPLVDAEAVRNAKFKIVVDAVNSVGGIIIPQLLRRMGVQVVELNCKADGHFAHNPEPLPENLTEIAAAVVANKANLGVVVDPDVDRLALVCEDGTMFGEEYTLVSVADYVLGRTAGNTVSNLSSSRALADVTQSGGEHNAPRGEYFAAAVGEVNVVAKMKEVGAVIGGEGNGGIIYPEIHYGRDALVGVALFLTQMAYRAESARAMRDALPTYFMSKNKIELTPSVDVDAILRTVKKKYTDLGERVTDIDGVKIDFPNEWVHLRKSNTEAIIRIYAESGSMEGAELLAQRIMDEIRAVAGGV